MANYFAKNLKYLREKKGLDQQGLAEKLNIPRSTLSCWENGIRTPKIEQIQDIASFFNVDIDIISKDYSVNSLTEFSNLEVLFDKAKGRLSPEDEAEIISIIKKTIEDYEKNKNNNQ